MTQLIEVPGIGQVEFPDGMSDADIASAIKKNMPAEKSAKTEAPKTLLGYRVTPTPEQHAAFQAAMQNGWGSGIPKLAYDVGGNVTDVTGSPLAGYLSNVLTQGLPALLSGYRMAGVPSPSITEKPASWLMQTAVKPKISDLASGDADKAIKTMLDEGIYPTRGGMEKLGKQVSSLDKTVSQAVANSSAEVPTSEISSALRVPYQRFRNQMTPQADMNAIRQVAEEFYANPQIAGKESIPVQLAHLLKKGTYQVLGSKAYGEVGTASTEAQKALAAGARQAVANAVPETIDPLAREAALMNVQDVAGGRAVIEGNKNPLGLAALRMDDPISAATFLADRWAALKALLAEALYKGGQARYALPATLVTPQPPVLQKYLAKKSGKSQ